MTAYNLRSLLLAAIIISNCITWTASRHHFTHNFYGLHSRHRRQGAGLFLASSFVIPTKFGESETEGWGEWGEVSPCSRTCGGGVASQKRICLKIGQDGEPMCRGGDTKYFSCQTQDCPEGSKDFRAEQCAEFNDREFRGSKYDWVPYTRSINPCELNCMPRGERFYYRHKDKVIDGTKCTDDSFDVCVDGTCQPVGCDMMLGSSAREDKCRKCRGNGTNCHTSTGIIDTQELMAGYNDLMLIPAGATSIVIEELKPSSNYLALRNQNGTFYLNGYYHIDFPRNMMIAGALCTYESSHIGLPAPDKIKCLGPIEEALYLSFLRQEPNVGIQYEYSLPSNLVTPTDKRYNWAYDQFTPCSASCGGGIQTRNVTCRTDDELEVHNDNLCDEGLKPASNQTCNTNPCPAYWVEGPWGACSKRCGKDGRRTREVNCQKIIVNRFPSLVADQECLDLHGPKPHLSEECNIDAPCPNWFVGRWKPCDKLCDEGKQTRQVVCYQKTNGRIEVLDDEECLEEKPEAEKPCLLSVCEGVDWVSSQWFGCDSCLSKVRTRTIKCVSRLSHMVVNDTLCELLPKPSTEELCDNSKLPTCTVSWYAKQWSKCSAECGKGQKTRTVFCGLLDGNSIIQVPDSECDSLEKYNDTLPCEVPIEKCPAQWFLGPWSNCSEDCNGGVKTSIAMCFKGNENSTKCPSSSVPDTTQLCKQTCDNPDQLLPVTQSSALLDDDYSDCDDDEYPEEGLDADTTNIFTIDDMLSDSPYTGSSYFDSTLSTEAGSGIYAEPESTLTTDSGSGFGSSFSSDDFLSLSPEEVTDSSIDVDEDYTTDSGDDEIDITKSTITDNTSISGETDSTKSATTDSTLVSEETMPIESTVTDGSTISGETDSTLSTVTDSSSVAKDTSSTETSVTDTTQTSDKTNSTESTVTDSSSASADTSATESIITDLSSKSEKPDSITTTSSGTGSTNTEETDSIDSTVTESTTVSGETSTTESTVTVLNSKSEETDSTKSTATETPGETSSTETVIKDGSSTYENTGSTESSGTEASTASDDTESTVTEGSSTSVVTDSTESTITDDSSTSEGTVTTESTATDISTASGDTEVTDSSSMSEGTESTGIDGSSKADDTLSPDITNTEGSLMTKETVSTDSTITSESSTTEGSIPSETTKTDESTPTDAGTGISVDVSGTTESLIAKFESTTTSEVANTESSTTESTATDISTASGVTEVTDSSSMSEGTESTEIDGSSKADDTFFPDITNTDGSLTTKETVSTDSTITSESSTTEGSIPSETTKTDESTPTDAGTGISVDVSGTTESLISKFESTTTSEVANTESSTTDSSIPETRLESTSTTAFGTESTMISETELTTLSTSETTISELESTTSGLESSTVSETESSLSTGESRLTSTSGPESTTELFESSSLSTTETTGSSEFSTTTEDETTSELTTEKTSSSVVVIFDNRFADKKYRCKQRRKKNCRNSKFGCCPDKKTHAAGPFQEGCNITRTCLETKYKCCPDGVTPAQGNNNQGCPPATPCEETLFGCCLSDNKTAAEGNDQEGCPPACKSSTYGCCADEETEATGPYSEGCPEKSTTEITSTELSTTTDIFADITTINETVTDTVTETETSTETGTESTTETSTESSEISVSKEENTTPFISSTIEEGCGDTKFGCCYDNETAALGPDGQGCPCNATEFGCCPDGIYPAQGENNLGCQGECRNSPHGCCQDNETPAHGPEFEGCCLQTRYGCCTDNRKPAQGPRLEGCDCQDTLHGCCPDNTTIAEGPNNEGCGCQYTEFGCCPDRHTPAQGPEFKGCSCHTFQFGCCPDGVTVAKEPQKQDCDCRLSTYGCCGDGETRALGPDFAGCDCGASKYGCCPDGVSMAVGPKFLGCTDLPENKQAVCSLPKDMGPGTDYKPMWFYDMSYGGCSYFWYGGIEGNGNRFASQAECEDICKHPSPKDACKLPSVSGPCDNNLVRWYYNSTMEQCIPFRYGGCLGNSNNFDTRELCQKQCEADRTTDTCNLPIEEGPCAGNFSRWGFNSKSRTCEQFTWGGCEGNSNRFNSETACEMRCNPPNVPKPECTLSQEAGNCTGKEALWSFSQSENRCLPFYYTGCGGNDNKFYSKETCEQTCPSAYVPELCTLPADVGTCSQYRTNWYYDTTIKSCRTFYYGGCGGNGNNFATQAACQNACSEPTTSTVKPQTQPAPQPAPDRPFSYTEYCFHDIDHGVRCPHAEEEIRYAYDKNVGSCVRFQFYGCGGTRNNFPTEEHCVYYCHTAQDVCQLPMLAGPCNESVMSWFYDPYMDSCSQFTYGGCEGNANRFDSREDCERRCKAEPAVTAALTTSTITTKAPITNAPLEDSVPAECRITPGLEECRTSGEVWYLDPRQQACVDHVNQDRGLTCRHTGTFRSQEACERACGAFREIDVCAQSVDPGPCTDFVTKVYFDQESGTCKQFAYSGCLGGANRFSSFEECTKTCTTETDLCLMQPEQGDCPYRYEQWYYNATSAQCNLFIYTGCHGNDNRFESRQDCEARCIHHSAVTTTTIVPIVPPDTQREECKTPASLSPCGRNQTVFYYDSSIKLCLSGEFGQCGYSNSYASEEECERECGAFRDTNVCRAPLDVGTCRNSVLKFYFDSTTGRCQPFQYSGCAGGPNRFSTVEECEQVCAGYGPAAPCLQELDTGYSNGCDKPSVPRYYYSTARADCIRFVYQGCGGNNNNFYSHEQCLQYCIGSGPNEVDCESYEQACAALVCAYGVLRSPAPGGCESCTCIDQATYCDQYTQECPELICPYGVIKTLVYGGCERCTCVDQVTHCEQYVQECDSLVCPFGINRIQDDGCERCVCHEDPCSTANCSSKELCMSTVYTDQVTQERMYTARCVPNYDINVVADCSRFQEECDNLKCEFGKQHIRTSDGCERCECITVQIDCAPLEEECNRLKCAYGIDKTVGEDRCVRCKCLEHPCASIHCDPGERCIVIAYRDPITQEPNYSTECRTVLKPGECPVDNNTSTLPCRTECNDDAECRGVGKCCRRGCSQMCLPPAPSTTRPPFIFSTTSPPNIPAAPQALQPPEPNVAVAEGGKATLRCLFHGNPPPKITWRRGEITIDGNVGRYRLLSDGALEIVSLYRNDTGVYICIADNGLGIATQEVNLIVNDPVATPVGISGDENAVVTGELDKPLQLRCMAYGYPIPDVHWEHHGSMVAFNDAIYEARENYLLIRRLTINTLGQYTCQAYNGIGKAASWIVSVRAYRPEGFLIEHEYLVPRYNVPVFVTTLSPFRTTRDFLPTTTTTTTTTTERQILFTVPVNAHVKTASSILNIGADLRLECEVDGYPDPNVHWTKDGVVIEPNDRISISGSALISRLVVSRVTVSDSGLYSCNANNGYTSHSANAQINVQQITVPARCTDNPYFAKCELIVQNKFCHHPYYSKFCCKSCVEAGLLDPVLAEAQADQPYRKK